MKDKNMSGEQRLRRLRDLVARLEKLPRSEERDRVIREVRGRAVDVDTGATPRAMLTVEPTGAARPERRSERAVPRPQPIKLARVEPRKDRPEPPPRWDRPVLRTPAPASHAIDLLVAGEQLCLNDSPVLHAPTAGELDHRPWARGLRG
jgi:hypothetical protein